MSEIVTITVSIITVTLLLYFVTKLVKKNHEYLKRPPCLFHLPIVGSLLSMPGLPRLHTFFLQKSKEIGNIFAVYMCNRYVVILNGKETIQDALVKQSLVFADRPLLYLAKVLKEEDRGIVQRPYTEQFKKFHGMSLNILKSFGFGQGIMESRIRVEVDNLLERLSFYDGQSVDPNYEITASVSNVICSVMFGKRWSVDDPQFREGIEIALLQVRGIEKIAMINFFPVLRFIPTFRKALELQLCLRERWHKHIKTILSNITDEEAKQSFYKILEKELENDGGGIFDQEDSEQLFLTIRDLFLAGTETTATTLLWFIVFMANHQDVQDQIRREIDQAVGEDGHPSLDDKPNLPILEATLLEVMRIRTLVPLSVPHSTLKDTYLRGMFIPAKTMVFVNLYSCHMDPDNWQEPEKFCIDRFLDETKTKVVNKNRVVSFSMGKRSCLGEILARQEMFLFASALIHQFEIHPAEGEGHIEVTEKVAVTNSPSAFKARFVKRKL